MDILGGRIEVIGIEPVVSRMTRMVQSEVGLIVQDEVVLLVTTIQGTILRLGLFSLNLRAQRSLELLSTLDDSALLEYFAEVALVTPKLIGNHPLRAS